MCFRCAAHFSTVVSLTRQQDGRTTTDLTNSLTGLAITERITALVQNSTSEARYILVVEKEAVFVRLAEDRLTAKIPAILVTGKGVPDLATRYDFS